MVIIRIIYANSQINSYRDLIHHKVHNISIGLVTQKLVQPNNISMTLSFQPFEPPPSFQHSIYYSKSY